MIKNSAKILEVQKINNYGKNGLYQIKISKPIYEFCSNTLL